MSNFPKNTEAETEIQYSYKNKSVYVLSFG